MASISPQTSVTNDWSALATAMVVLNMFGNCFFFALGNSHVSYGAQTNAIAESSLVESAS